MNRFGMLCAAGLLAGGVLLSAQSAAIPAPRRGAGDSITAAYEGWFYNADGSRSFLVGYYKRNSQQTLDMPIGPNIRIDPRGPHMIQPTHFLPGRRGGMFIIPAPQEFKPTGSFTWTIVANGKSTTIPFRLNPDYVMSPLSEIAVGNTPPVLKFDPPGKTFQGPLATVDSAVPMSASVAAPMPLNVVVTDDAKFTSGTNAPPSGSRSPVSVRWSKYRGPGAVTFDKARPELQKIAGGSAPFTGKADATAKFSEPGDYMLHLTGNDYSGDGGGGFGCCWTTSLVKVTVKP